MKKKAVRILSVAFAGLALSSAFTACSGKDQSAAMAGAQSAPQIAVQTVSPEDSELAKTYPATPENAYFILEQGQCIGLGQLIDGELAAVASLEPGCGEKSLIALARELPGPRIHLLCAEENTPATRLYDRLGFSRDRVKRIWYKVV